MPETPVFSTAAVAAPHMAAAETGQTILAAGGNAVEAMVAMAASVTSIFVNALWRRPSLFFDAVLNVGRGTAAVGAARGSAR